MPTTGFHRRSIRLQGFDYSQPGSYFVTLVTCQRECLFGEVLNGEMRPGQLGEIAAASWAALAWHFRNIELDEFVVMPNHLHGIIVIVNEPARRGEAMANVTANRGTFMVAIASPLQPTPARTTPHGTTPRSLNAVMQNFKSVTSRRIRKLAAYAERPIWQRNYYEHVVRDAPDLERIRAYIRNNPAKWSDDDQNPERMHARSHT